MSAALKLLISNTNYRSEVVGGGQLSVQVLAEGLAAAGHDVTVVSLGQTAAEERHNGVRHLRLELLNEYWPFDGEERSALAKLRWHLRDADNRAMATEFEKIVDSVAPDVLHTNVMTGFSAAIWRAAARRGVPVVHTLRDYHAVCSRSSLFRSGRPCAGTCLDCRLLTVASRRLSDRVAAVVGNSRDILETHLRLGAFTAVPLKEVVYNAYSGPRNPPATTLRPGPLRLGFLGRLAAHKGIELLLEAVAKMPAHDVELVVAGDGNPSYRQALESRFEGPRVRFLGFVPPTELFAQIDVLVVPSLWPEPLPRTVFEAYANGLPVIGSDRGGTPEIIVHGVTGLIFDPAVEGSLEDAIGKLAAERHTLPDLSRAAAEKSLEFLPERVVGRYSDIYREVLGATLAAGAGSAA